MNHWQWLVAAMSLTGVWLNIQKHPGCFMIWTVTNGAWMFVDFYAGIFAQAFIQLIYLLLSIYGLYKWTREAKPS